MLVVSEDQVFDIDRVLSYASRYMKNLKHIQIKLLHNLDKTVMSAEVLQSFLHLRKGNLESLVWGRYPSTDFTNGGKVWTELHGLKYVEMTHPIFSNCKDLVKIINQQQKTIECLSLISIKLGDNRGTRNDWTNVASSIGKCRHLIRLNLNQHILRDSDMEVLLSSLPNLKVLLLCGPLNIKGGHLTDKTCKIIARTCKELREINLAYQGKITFTGIKRVLKSCQHLRNIRLSMVLSQMDVISMHNMAPSLIFMTMRFEFDQAQFDELIEATHGLVVFCHYDNTLLNNGERLSEETQRRYLHREALLQMYDMRLDDPKVTDEWALLDTFKNQIHRIEYVGNPLA